MEFTGLTGLDIFFVNIIELLVVFSLIQIILVEIWKEKPTAMIISKRNLIEEILLHKL